MSNRVRSRSQRRTAGAALIWAAVFFLGFQLILAAFIAWRLPEIADPVFGARFARLHAAIAASSRQPLVLMLGSSRTAYGLNAAGLEANLSAGAHQPVRVFNFGTLGAGPVTQLLHFRRLLDAGIKPDLLLIEVLPPFLAGQLPVPAEARWLPSSSRLRTKDLATLRRYYFPLDGLRRTRRLSWMAPVYAFRSALLSRWLTSWQPYAERLDWAWNGDTHGWTAQTDALTPEAFQASVRRDRQNYAAALTGFHTRGAPAKALRQLLAACRQRGIAARLVLMPESSEFRRWYPAEVQTQLEALLKEVQRTYGVPCIDARCWVKDEDFFDAHHLRANGATAFSICLGSALRSWLGR